MGYAASSRWGASAKRLSSFSPYRVMRSGNLCCMKNFYRRPNMAKQSDHGPVCYPSPMRMSLGYLAKDHEPLGEPKLLVTLDCREHALNYTFAKYQLELVEKLFKKPRIEPLAFYIWTPPNNSKYDTCRNEVTVWWQWWKLDSLAYWVQSYDCSIHAKLNGPSVRLVYSESRWALVERGGHSLTDLT